MKRILVTGSNGQLGRTIQKIAENYLSFQFFFTDSDELDITDSKAMNNVFQANNFDYCINCAAYTNVEQAEKAPKPSFLINAKAVGILAEICKKNGVILIHISTDYVFDGYKNTPYTINDIPNPINEYGKSKLLGEKKVQEVLNQYHIVRTSWLYSEFGNNFYKMILNKSKTEKVLRITDQQTGCPTKAINLAKFILEELILKNADYGLHHFTDGNAMTWYSFAKKILKDNKMSKNIKLEKAKDFSTFAKRPRYSVLE